MTVVKVVDKTENNKELLTLGDLLPGDFVVDVVSNQLLVYVEELEDYCTFYSLNSSCIEHYHYEDAATFKPVSSVKVIYKTK